MSIIRTILKDKIFNRIRPLPSSPVSTDQLRSIDEVLAQSIEDQRYAPDFFRSLLSQNLVAIAPKLLISEDLESEGFDYHENFQLVSFADHEGSAYIPIFSNRDYVPQQEIKPEHEVIEMMGRRILTLALLARSPVVLNPGRLHSRTFLPEDLETVLDRLTRKPHPLSVLS